MSRLEYYLAVEKELKESIRIPCTLQFLSEGTTLSAWMHAAHGNPTNNSRFKFLYVLNGMNYYIDERAFDKYYLPFVKYDSKSDVEYRESDVAITVNNLKYCILNDFQRNFLTK